MSRPASSPTKSTVMRSPHKGGARSAGASRGSVSGDSSESTGFTLRSLSSSPVSPLLQRPVRELTPGERVKPELPKLNPNVTVFKPCMTEFRLPDLSNLNMDDWPSTPGPTQKTWADLSASPALFPQNVATPSSTATFELRTPQIGNWALPGSALSWSEGSPGTLSDMAWYMTPAQSEYVAMGNQLYNQQKKQAKTLSPADSEAAHALGRYIMISGFPRATTELQLKHLIKTYAEFRAIIVKMLAETGSIVVIFHDSRDAWDLAEGIRTGEPKLLGTSHPVALVCSKIEKVAAEHMVNQLEEWRQVFDESEPCIRIELDIPVNLSNVRSALEKIGPLYSLLDLAQSGKTFLAEFWDCRHASQAVKYLDGVIFEDSILRARFAPSIGEPFAQRCPPPPDFGASFKQPRRGNVLSAGEARVPTYDVFGPVQSMPPVPGRPGAIPGKSGCMLGQASARLPAIQRTTGPHPASIRAAVRELGYQVRERIPERLTAVPRRNGGRFHVSPENMVFPQRVKFGQDPRTTVMIKDVPNRLSRDELVKILDAVVPGGFDFVYLRFDFHNGCNLGYGFINFTSTEALFRFICTRVGRKWNMYSSEKVLQISYADTQGKQDLITKFRGSVVMRVHEQWRPVFFHSSGPLKGQREDVFEADEYRGQPGDASNWWDPSRAERFTPSSTHSDPYTYSLPTAHDSEYV